MPRHRFASPAVPLTGVLLAAALSLLSSCSEPDGPADATPGVLPVAAQALTPAAASTLVLWVTAADLKTPYGFNLTVTKGAAYGALPLPMGGSRLLTALLYDADGTETYRGTATTYVEAGLNPTVNLTAKARYGGSPITVKLDITGVALGGSIVVKLPTATLVPGQTVQLTASVYDNNGKLIPGAKVLYSSMDPSRGMADSVGRLSATGSGQITLIATTRYPWLVGLTATVIKVLAWHFNWTDVSAGNGFSCGIRGSDNAMACWGILNGTAYGSKPQLLNDGHTYAQVSAGVGHACGVTTGNQVLCWGDGSSGQLGNGGVGSSSAVPVAIQTSTRFTQVSAGTAHTCAVAIDQHVECWGDNSDGALGTTVGFQSTTATPTPVQPPNGERFLAVSAGEDFTCGVTTTNGLFCWGQNAGGQLGINNNIPNFTHTPMRVVNTTMASLVSTGFGNGALSAPVCEVGNAPSGAFCWGDNSSSELGNGSTHSFEREPFNPVPLPYLPKSISAGMQTVCVTFDGLSFVALPPPPDAFCWGHGTSGEIGNGQMMNQGSPTAVYHSNSFSKISAGFNHVCALNSLGYVSCWGDGKNGELGAGPGVLSSSRPVGVPAP